MACDWHLAGTEITAMPADLGCNPGEVGRVVCQMDAGRRGDAVGASEACMRAHENTAEAVPCSKEWNRYQTRRIGTGTGRRHPHIRIAPYAFWRMPGIAQFNSV